ncbi:MAG: hypothetical protein AVDCRST_MAG40-1266, partial [uncultured Gemmatimonadaceae bacterium]
GPRAAHSPSSPTRRCRSRSSTARSETTSPGPSVWRPRFV